MEKIAIAKELLKISKEIVAGMKVASVDVEYKWEYAFRGGRGGTYTAVIEFTDSANSYMVAEAIMEAGKTMYKRMEKAGLEPDTPEVVRLGQNNAIYIVQDEVFTGDYAKGDETSRVTDAQVKILLKG